MLRAVPPVAGMTVAQATAALAGRNFTPGRQIPVAAMGVAPGTVVGPTDTSVLAEGSAVDLQIATGVVARSPFSFAVADAPRVKVAQSQLIGRMLLTTAGRIDVTLDAYPYKRIQRWHFFHVKAGETILRMKLRHPLKPGTYRLFWKATSAADHSVLRKITPMRVAVKGSTSGQVVVISSGRSTQGLETAPSVAKVEQLSSAEQAYLYATYHNVAVMVINADTYGLKAVRTLQTVFPQTTVVAIAKSAAARRAVTKAGAIAVPANAPASVISTAIAAALRHR